mmetsp:Transcript_3135/g.4236  ORF Transcript_3135/g.4236 Transcript_3135/m.4236 type:complete len:393 (+) Transcript_3135:98-1276(+)
MDSTSARAAWEGLGGPVHIDDHRALAERMMDPTLDSCCQRDIEDNLKMSALRRTLQRHDVVAARERRRRHLVDATGFQGCRCLYDPQADGGEYPALNELKTERQQSIIGEVGDSLSCVVIRDDNEEKKKEESAEDRSDDDSDDEFDYLLDDDLSGQGGEELKMIEEQRRIELEMEIFEREMEMQHGYGTHRQMHPTRSLKAAGLTQGTRDPPPFVVVHLFDGLSSACALLDLYLEELAQQMRGTKFIRSDGRMTFVLEASLVQKALPRLRVDSDVPCLIAVKDGVAIQTAPLKMFIDNSENVVTGAVYEWLRQSGVLHERPPVLEALCRLRPEEEALLEVLVRDDQLPKQEDIYCCGVTGCQKTFMHQHVGIETKEQSGLVVPEHEILGQVE